MKTKKLLSILLALMMVLSVVPMYASAAEPITLTEANVTVWPTVSGEIYYGQKINEGITLSGGEIQYEGTVVPGHFEFVDPELRTNLGIPNLKFVPDDTTSYSVSEIGYAWDLMFTINKTTPVFVDANSVPVATEVASAGTLLGKSKISGGQVMNPYYPEESVALGYTWSWVNRREPVTKSGYYEAQLGGGMYNTITTMIYVKIAGDTPETSIEEAPTFPRIEYNPDITWADIPLTGGKAVINGNEEVAGTFTISETWKNKVPEIGSYNVSVVFTPDDLSKASVYTMLIPVTVNKGQMKFVDENGNEIVPEITVPYGTKFNDVSRLLKPYVKGPEYVYFAMGDLSSQLCANGTYTVTATAPSDGAHYEDTELTFKIVVEPKVINPKFYSTTGGSYIQDNSGIYRPEGTFDIYVDDELVHSGIKYLEDKFELTFPENVTATYTIKAVYNPVENDNFAIADIISQKNVIAKHGLTLKNGIANYKLGDNTLAKSINNETISITEGTVVALEAVSEDFAEWIITDAKGNALDLDIKTVVTNVDENGGITWETVDGDLSCENIIFTMPTEDVIITLRTTKDIAAENCDHICHSDNPLFQMLWKVLTFIFRLFDVQQYCDCGNLHYDAPLFG